MILVVTPLVILAVEDPLPVKIRVKLLVELKLVEEEIAEFSVPRQVIAGQSVLEPVELPVLLVLVGLTVKRPVVRHAQRAVITAVYIPVA